MRRLREYVDYAVAGTAYVAGRLAGRSMAAVQLTPLDSSVTLSPLVHRVLGANPGPFTLQGTNTYLVGESHTRILIDAGEPNVDAYVRQLKETLGADGQISAIICTHWHHDHTGGVANVVKQVIGHDVPVYKLPRSGSKATVETGFIYVENGHRFETPGATLRVVYTPGHTDDHMSLLLEEENALFSGDCVLGEGTTIFDDLHTYMNSLQLLLTLNPTRIYPGHGPVVEDPKTVLEQYIEHRLQREREILNVLQAGPASSMEITNQIYKDIPVAVKLGALANVNHHLAKLEKEKKVSCISYQWSLCKL